MSARGLHFDANLAMSAVVAAAQGDARYVVDRDPKDGEHVVPGELRRFLARLRLLHGLPFSYLVPDAQLLPPESIRFFHLDRAWTDALVQGALSVGTLSSADRAQLERVYPHLRAEVDDTERSVREPQNQPPLRGRAGAITGFLLRSRAVSGWPNLHVRAYARDVLKDDALTTEAESHPERLKLLRLERLAPAVLLALIDGVPAVVHIEEPRQGLQFGVRMDPDAPPDARGARIKLRNNRTGAHLVPPAPGQDDDVYTDANSEPVPFRAGAPGVIAMAELRRRLSARVPDHAAALLEPNEMALQLLRFPYRQVFGDPANPRVGKRFFDMDRFQVKLPLAQWSAKVTTLIDGVLPPPVQRPRRRRPAPGAAAAASTAPAATATSVATSVATIGPTATTGPTADTASTRLPAPAARARATRRRKAQP